MIYFWNYMYTHFKTEKVLFLNIMFYRFGKLYKSRSKISIYFFLLLDINYTRNLLIYNILYVIVFHFLLPCNTINHVARRKC